MTVYTFTTLPAGTVFNTAYGINAAGQIVGWYIGSDVTHGYLYSGGTYTGPFDEPSATNGTFNRGVNFSGQIAGYYLDSSNVAHGFLYSGVWTTIDDPLAGHGGPLSSKAPMQRASTTRVRSLGTTSTAATSFTASFTAASATLPSTIP